MFLRSLEEAELARKEWQYERVKKICHQPSPDGLDPCQEAAWRYTKFVRCKKAREEWDRRWGSRKGHGGQISEVQNAIDNALADMIRICKGPQVCRPTNP